MNTEYNIQGKCDFCYEIIDKSKINTHLKKHIKDLVKQNADDEKESFLLQVFTYPNYKNSPYFLYLLVDGGVTMKKVDRFLRDIWLECCGHMSEFCFKGGGKLGMSNKIQNVLEKGYTLEYKYDFGTTTYLQIKVVESYPLQVKEGVKLLSRNEPLEIYCHLCHKNPATQICAVDQWEDQPHMFCEQCALKHAEVCSDFEVYVMPVVNSPRMGECGYEGGVIDKERDGTFVIK